MDWHNPELETAMREITGIYEGDIMLSDVSPLSGATKLELLWINDNNITDIPPVSFVPLLQY